MVATTAISKIELEPGSVITIPDVVWQEFEALEGMLGRAVIGMLHLLVKDASPWDVFLKLIQNNAKS